MLVVDVDGGVSEVQFVAEHFAAGTAHGVVGRDLDHYLVQILDDVLELFCFASVVCGANSEQRPTLQDLVVHAINWRHRGVLLLSKLCVGVEVWWSQS